ncbi:MAG TPA: hypothetical protein VFN35_26995 [Ktedonobacteraceae bacterium]|nr:hypothetical protein [Ktedonobacteraceae bacterium]
MQGKIAEASSAFDEGYQLSKQGIGEYEALAIYGQARVAQTRNKISEAQRLGQESLTLLQAMEHYRAPEVEQWLKTLET